MTKTYQMQPVSGSGLWSVRAVARKCRAKAIPNECSTWRVFNLCENS